jgi:hypothetical protein
MVFTLRAFRLTTRDKSDGSFPVATVSSADLDVKEVDPTALRMGDAAVIRNSGDLLMASIEIVTGFQGHSLIVYFDRHAAKPSSRMKIEGTTYAGVPIHATLEAL